MLSEFDTICIVKRLRLIKLSDVSSVIPPRMGLRSKEGLKGVSCDPGIARNKDRESGKQMKDSCDSRISQFTVKRDLLKLS